MCANPSTDAIDAERTVPASLADALPPKADQLGVYLDNELDAETELYVKSRFIAEEIDLSPKEVGWYLRQLQETPGPLTVEQWAYTNGTTWRITRDDGTTGHSQQPGQSQ